MSWIPCASCGHAIDSGGVVAHQAGDNCRRGTFLLNAGRAGLWVLEHDYAKVAAHLIQDSAYAPLFDMGPVLSRGYRPLATERWVYAAIATWGISPRRMPIKEWARRTATLIDLMRADPALRAAVETCEGLQRGSGYALLRAALADLPGGAP